MKKRDIKMIEKIMSSKQQGYAFYTPLEGGPREVYLISTTPKNLANFIGDHFFDAEEITITDLFDNLILKTCGGFIERCPDQKLCQKIVQILAPIQMGEKEAGKVLQIRRDISDAYFAEKDAEMSMAEMSMG